MSGITKWLLGIFVAAVVGVAVDLIFSGTRMSRTLSCVTATVMLAVIAAPLPSLIKSGFSVSGSQIFSYEPQLDENYLVYVDSLKAKELGRELVRRLESDGIRGAKAEVTLVRRDGSAEIESVTINLSETVIDGETEHINMTESAARIATELLGVDNGRVHVYG